MPAIEIGQVKLIRIQTSRIRSLVDGKVAMAKRAQNAATRKPTLAQIAIRSFMVPLLPFSLPIILQRKMNHESVQYCSGAVEISLFHSSTVSENIFPLAHLCNGLITSITIP